MQNRSEVEIRIEDISHRYNSQLAVDHVSFTLAGHKIVGLLGANGAGKSTLMNIICGALTPTAGDVKICGKSIRTEPVEAKNLIGFLPQKPPLIPDLTVEEYLHYAAKLRFDGKVRMLVAEAMERCGIMHFRKRLIKHLSGGYQQRVGIAQAMIHHPSFIVLDEPTNGLDPMQIIEIRKLIHQISQDCMVFLSTHILQEVQLTCEHILMMNSGHLIFNGGIQEFNCSILPRSIIVSLVNKDEAGQLMEIDGVTSIEEVFDEPKSVRLLFEGDADTVCENIIHQTLNKNIRITEVRKEQPLADDIFKYLSTNRTK